MATASSLDGIAAACDAIIAALAALNGYVGNATMFASTAANNASAVSVLIGNANADTTVLGEIAQLQTSITGVMAVLQGVHGDGAALRPFTVMYQDLPFSGAKVQCFKDAAKTMPNGGVQLSDNDGKVYVFLNPDQDYYYVIQADGYVFDMQTERWDGVV